MTYFFSFLRVILWHPKRSHQLNLVLLHKSFWENYSCPGRFVGKLLRQCIFFGFLNKAERLCWTAAWGDYNVMKYFRYYLFWARRMSLMNMRWFFILVGAFAMWGGLCAPFMGPPALVTKRHVAATLLPFLLIAIGGSYVLLPPLGVKRRHLPWIFLYWCASQFGDWRPPDCNCPTLSMCSGDCSNCGFKVSQDYWLYSVVVFR